MSLSVGARAAQIFTQAERDIGDEIRPLYARAGISGGSIRQSVRIFEAGSARALGRCLDEVANKFEPQSKQWRAAVDEINGELDGHLSKARVIITRDVRHEHRGRVDAAIDGLIATASANLSQQLVAYREGYTAPKAKHWVENNPVKWAIILMVLGAMVGQAIEEGWKYAFPEHPISLAEKPGKRSK